ncbi:MAG: T9SS type A sorting domain-containing protein, partial [Saprospiraceae bacterium]|nr:T9SS type A sorting domain-containing protein [Saprospiraceae bacterium]
FTLKLRARTDVKLSDVISINSSITPMLGFDKALEDSRIQLRSSVGVATEFVLLQNEPNPWSATTSIGMLLPHKGEVMLTIYDATGKIYYKEEKTFNKGYNEWMIEKTQIESNGVYYYQVDFDTNTQTRKMVILK